MPSEFLSPELESIEGRLRKIVYSGVAQFIISQHPCHALNLEATLSNQFLVHCAAILNVALETRPMEFDLIA